MSWNGVERRKYRRVPIRLQLDGGGASPDGRFEHRAELVPGGFAEVCGRLARGSAVRWSFDAAGALDFNIHYHQDKQVVFPVKRSGAAKGAATLKVKLDQDYCWMWTNKTTQALSLHLTLAR